MTTDARVLGEIAQSRLLAAQRGDRDAQAELFAEHHRRVAQQILRMTGEPAAVDDLVQEVFLAAFLALPGFRGDAQLSSWLHTIARNKVHNWWNSRSRRRSRESAHAAVQVRLSESPEDDLMVAQQRARFYEALAALPSKLREAFIARTLEGMSLQEAAAALDTPISTISYRARRAEELLCATLEIPCEGPPRPPRRYLTRRTETGDA